MSRVIDISIEENKLTQQLMDCFFRVHKALGPGLLESVYETCLCHEIGKRGFFLERQKSLPVHYDGLAFESGLRLDLVVEQKIIIELKSVETLLPVHEAQILSYLRLSGMEIGFLVNFNVPLIKNGVRRFVNNHAPSAPPR